MSKQEGNKFDNIFKENLAAVFVPLADKFFHVKVESWKPLPGKLQTTIEKEPDFLGIVKTVEDAEFIFHLELQAHDDADMLLRMAEYKGILQRKYKLAVKQFVLYLGDRHWRYPTELPPDMQIKGFDLASVFELNYKNLLNSDVPEEIMLAILADFEGVAPEAIIRLIIRKLKSKVKHKVSLQKFIKQLTVLSRLRKLDEELNKELKTMPITYDYKQDAFYKDGLEEGIEKGIEKGIEQGGAIEKKNNIIAILEEGTFSISKIATLFNVSEKYVLEILEELNSSK